MSIGCFLLTIGVEIIGSLSLLILLPSGSHSSLRLCGSWWQAVVGHCTLS